MFTVRVFYLEDSPLLASHLNCDLSLSVLLPLDVNSLEQKVINL